MNSIIEEIYNTDFVMDKFGNKYKLNSQIDKDEGKFIFNLIKEDSSIQKTLEVGCAYGLSSLFICSAISGRDNIKHVIIDPFQFKDWNGIGILNLKKSGFDFFDLIVKPSEFALPELTKREEGTYDMIFIDGFHTFDHTLLDVFYANRLLRVGGYIIIDDCWFKSVSKSISYLSKYPSYKIWSQVKNNSSQKSRNRKIGELITKIIPEPIRCYIFPKFIYEKVRPAQYSSMVAFKKISEDKRRYDWFEDF